MALTDYITDQCNAIREKDGTTAPIPYTEIASRIRAIPSGGGGGSEWQPHPDWWNIKSMVDTGVLEWSGEHIDNVRYGYVVSDGHPTTKLVAGYEYYLSDGSYYNGAATHTWDRSQDKPCNEGYTTRAVIVVKAADRDVAISQRSLALDGIASLYIYLGDCNVTSLVCGHSTATSANRALKAVLCDEKNTANSGAIGANAFRGCFALASVTIPQGVTSIGDYAFNGSPSLVSVTIPQGVTSIGNSAFSGCFALASVTIPQGVTSIGDYAFNGSPSLVSVTIPQGVTSIGNNVFSGCSGLASVTIPQGVTSIGASAFSSCYALASVTIPQGVTSIGATAYNGCYALASVTIPQGVTSIGNNAFSSCYALASLNVPVGFNISVTLSSSPLLSPASLEQLITNAADMSGQTAITFTLGAANLAKLSEEYIQLAAAKNITLA